MEPVILMRASLAEESEMEVAKKHFPVITQRSHVKNGDLVIPRYSALPWYKEFEEDVKYVGGSLINTYRQHCYVADLRNWYYDLADFTPRTWFYLDQIPSDGGPYVLKGATNSKKQFWNTHMFAADKKQATEVFLRIANDGYIGHQNIYIRKYVPLKSFGEGLNGLPITEEYRIFVLDGKIMSSGFYWSEHSHIAEENNLSPNNIPYDFLQKVIDIVSPNIRFFVVDVARTQDNSWIVVELNDGSQSGLSENNPEILYANLNKRLHG